MVKEQNQRKIDPKHMTVNYKAKSSRVHIDTSELPGKTSYKEAKSQMLRKNRQS